MTTAPINAAMLNIYILALTPIQRWEAARNQPSGDFLSGRLFIIAAALTLIVLTVFLVRVSLRRMKQKKTQNDSLFHEYSKKTGLSSRESQILTNIANKAGLEQNEAIFTTSHAFDKGANIMVQENLNKQQESEENELLKTELVILREKLGFQKQASNSIGIATKARKLSSRQIPVSKKLHITRRKTHSLYTIESTVIKNDDFELALKLGKPFESSPGEFWLVRYYFGASVWEFDTTSIRSDGDIMVLNHNDDVRFINRRRFLRVPVNKPAFVATFPFSKEIVIEGDKINDNSSSKQAVDEASRSNWVPEFVPVVITELAGPGLRMDIPIEVNEGDRVLVAFRLDDDKQQENASPQQALKVAKFKIVEDIGEVRNTKTTDNGYSIAVELTGLSDSDVNELICATNAASIKTNGKAQKTKEDALETAAV